MFFMVSNLFSVVHEGGHALYELHVGDELLHSALAHGTSMTAFLKAAGAEGKALVVTPEVRKNVVLSARNIPGVKTTIASILCVYDILRADKLIADKDAVLKIQEVYAK